MLIYHGSNMIVENPKIFDEYRQMDFGGGFYCTASKEQAIDFTDLVYKRNKKGNSEYNKPKIVSIYEIDLEKAMNELNSKKFVKGEEWFDFVDENRGNRYVGEKYDIIVGPVANDNTYTTFTAYRAKALTKAQAIEQLMPMKLADQVLFTTQKALSYLTYKGFEEVKND
jgi:hypothetical protein